MIRVNTTDTIVAISSSAGDASRSIVRLSGPVSWAIARRVVEGLVESRPSRAFSWRARVKTVFEGTGSLIEIPCRLQFWPSGRSYTGQESVELHLDVTNVLAEAVSKACVGLGARHAEPGEFTLRSYLEGRIDLTRAEAVAGIFQANTSAQLEVALDQLAGGIGRNIDRLRNRILDLSAWLEATLDFVEESDVDPISRNFVAEELRGFAWELDKLASIETKRDRSTSVRRIVLVGRPNAGKSQLFNVLCGSAGRALVSPTAGTTRDYLEAQVDLGDRRTAILVDTAGELETDESIDFRSQTLGLRERLLADLYLICVPVDEPVENVIFFESRLPANTPRIVLRTKSDLVSPDTFGTEESLRISATTGAGIKDLRAKLRLALDQFEPETGSVVTGTRIRAGESLQSARRSLTHAAEALASGGGDELAAIDLRAAVEALDVVSGRDATEETLDRIFSRFCIGK